jgi:hypothetical protein
MEQLQAICFAASHLHWLTRAETSHGWFQLDALLDWWPPTPQPPLQFVLAASVPAGRMYASSGTLLKQPPYSFQLIAGHQEHTILRRPLNTSQAAVPGDSSQPHSPTFQDLSWQLIHAPAQSLPPEGLLALPSPPPTLNLLLEWRHRSGLLRLQAPLRHWNHRAEPAGWQIESGPLLWPLDRLAFAEAPSSAGLTTAWLHANQAGRVTMSGDRLPCHELEARLSLLALT